MHKLRRGSILLELIIALLIFGSMIALSTQMLQYLRQDIQQMTQLARQREMQDLVDRIATLGKNMTRIGITKGKTIRFDNAKHERCDIKLHGNRLIYQKERAGYYVLATHVKTVYFAVKNHISLFIKIEFEDGVCESGQFKLYGNKK